VDGKAMLKTALYRSHDTGIKLADIKGAVARSLDREHLILETRHYPLAKDRDGAGMSRAAIVGALEEEGPTKKRAEAQVRKAIARGEFVLTGTHYTTQSAREREKRILQIEREGRDQVTASLRQGHVIQSDKYQTHLVAIGLGLVDPVQRAFTGKRCFNRERPTRRQMSAPLLDRLPTGLNHNLGIVEVGRRYPACDIFQIHKRYAALQTIAYKSGPPSAVRPGNHP